MRRLLSLLLLAASPAWAQLPSLTLEQLPRPTMPPGERGPVVPAQVERWRQDAKALEYGDGVKRDEVAAAKLYCRAARYGDAEAQYSLGWMLTNARGIQRNDAEAAHLFAAAAEQGMEQAQNMLDRMGGTPLGEPPRPRKRFVTAPSPSVPPGSRFASLRAMVEEAQRRPGEIPYASSGPGSTVHLMTELFCLRAGISLQHVPYRGTAGALTDPSAFTAGALELASVGASTTPAARRAAR